MEHSCYGEFGTHFDGVDGALRVEIKKHNIFCCKCPFSKLDALNSDKLKSIGIYFLCNTEKKLIYIGKCESKNKGVIGRAKESTHHARGKMDADEVVMFTSKKFDLTDVGFLEQQCYHFIPKEHGVFKLVNTQKPPKTPISNENKKIESKEKLESIRQVLMLLGYGAIFKTKTKEHLAKDLTSAKNKATKPTKSIKQPQAKLKKAKTENPSLELSRPQGLLLHIKRQPKNAQTPIKAWCIRESAEKYTILKGSNINPVPLKSAKSSLKLKEKLINSGDIKDNVFQKNISFAKPSTASTLILGGSSSGNVDWITEDGVALGTYLARQQALPEKDTKDSEQRTNELKGLKLHLKQKKIL